MRSSITLLLTVTVLLLVSAPAQARVSHGYSGIFTIDTVTAVDDDAAPAASDDPDHDLPESLQSPHDDRVRAGRDRPDRTGDLRPARPSGAGRWSRARRPTGRYQTTWDGQDDEGRAVPTGTYFCRLSTPQGSQTKKLTLAR